MPLNPRHQKLLDELPKHNYKVKPSAIKAGYSESYANDHAKKILKTALKAQAREVMEIAQSPASISKDMKKELIEIIGLGREDLYKRLKYIAFDQDKDLASAIKILGSIARDSGIALSNEEAPKTIVPILNIGVKQVDIPLIDPNDPSLNGLT